MLHAVFIYTQKKAIFASCTLINTIMTKKLRSRSFGELAAEYFPDTCDRHARRKLRNWINLCKPLRIRLADLSYTDTTRALTPRMVLMIYQYLGEP